MFASCQHSSRVGGIHGKEREHTVSGVELAAEDGLGFCSSWEPGMTLSPPCSDILSRVYQGDGAFFYVTQSVCLSNHSKLKIDVLQHAAIGSKSTVVERRTKTKVRGQGDRVDDGAGAAVLLPWWFEVVVCR